MKIFYILFLLTFVSSCSTPPSECFETYEVGTKLNKDILKRASQVWLTPKREVIIVFNELDNVDNYNPHLLLFNEELKLQGEIHFGSSRIEEVNDTAIIAKEGSLYGRAEYEKKYCTKNKLGSYSINYVPFRFYGTSRRVAKLIDTINIDPRNFNITFKYRVRPNNGYYFIEEGNIEGADSLLTEKKELMLSLNQLEVEDASKFLELTRSDSISHWEYLIPKDEKIIDKFYDELYTALLQINSR